jgi:signal transduction histidine kinase/CheY-like chemotaxis protein
MNPFFSAVATTLQLQAPFTMLMALIVFRLWRTYRIRPMRDLAIGWTLWTGRMIVVSYASALRAMGHAATSPERRLLTALGIGLVLAALPFLVRGTINIAKGDDDAPSPGRWSLVLAVSFMVASVIATQPGVPDQWRLGMLVFSSTISFTLAFGYVAWRLLRMPSDALTTGRQLAAFGFGAYALKQLWNVRAFVNAGAPDPAASAIAENIVLIMVAMGSIALLFDRLRQREVQSEREQRRLEAELAAREHLESLGRLAGGVAHDFNNMLTSILGSAQLARQDIATPARLVEELESIESTATRASALTKQLLTFARREQTSPVAFDTVRQVNGVRRYIERQLGDGIVLDLQLPDSPLIVLADPSRFDQAIVNLVINARDALIDQRGTIRISVAREQAALDGADAVRVSIEDDGEGMDAATQARIFEPFFSTKGRERGTGLGLSIVHGAVTLAGGTIRVTSQPQCGTRFDMLFPLHSTVALPQVSFTEVFPPEETHRQRVLIVDDDPQVLRVAVRLMQRRGFDVQEALGAEDALALHSTLSNTSTPIDLLLTDLIMPGMSGRTLACLLRERDPRLAVVFMSGYDDESAPGTPKDSDTPFVSKPFNETQLMMGVREALSRRVA